MRGKGGQAFAEHAGWAAGVAAVGLVLAAAMPRQPENRLAALVGVGLAAVTGAVALVLKRRAVRVDTSGALKVVGVVFGLRALAVVAGLWWVATRGLGRLAFVVGFFGVYLVLQWIEVSFVMAAAKDAAGGDEE